MANERTVQLWKEDAQVFLGTDSIVNNDGTKTLTTLLSEKQSELTSDITLFSYKIGSGGTPSDLKFGGTLTLPEGSSNGDENVIETVKVNGTALAVTDKAVNIDLSGYQQAESGKGLSTNDFTTALLTKLNNLPTTVYISSQEMNNASTVYQKINTADTGNIPPTIVIQQELGVISCPLSYYLTDSNSAKVYSGVYGTFNSLIQIIIEQDKISTFELRVTDSE